MAPETLLIQVFPQILKLGTFTLTNQGHSPCSKKCLFMIFILYNNILLGSKYTVHVALHISSRK